MTRRILALAIPNIISNISVPLLSIADTAIAGRMPHASSLGAVALSAMVVNFSYWLWGFLRMATTGFTAQAWGRGDEVAMSRQFSVGTAIALLGGLLIILLSPLLAQSLELVGGAEVKDLLPEAERYLRTAYWGAPAALLLYVYNGWFVGMQNTTIPMYITIGSNILNIVVSYALVRCVGMGVEGIALGTVLSQYLAILSLALLAIWRHRSIFAHWRAKDFFALTEVFTYLHIAKFLLLRTLMLGSISLYFVHSGASYGATTLAANTLLMQLFTTFSYFMDGFAYAGEALTGRYIGAKRKDELQLMLRQLMTIGAVIAPFIALVYYAFSEELLSILSDKAEILAEAISHRHWAVAIPIVSFAAFLWDGVFVGATNSKPMMLAVSLAWITFFIVYLTTSSLLGVDALWLAFVLYLAVRSGLATYWGVRLVRSLRF